MLISALFTAYVIATGRADLRIFNSSGLVHLWEFALGMIAGQRFGTRDERFWEAPIRWVLPVTCVSITVQAVLSIWGGSVGELLNNPASLVGFGGVVILAYRTCLARGWNAITALIDWTGEISYSLYLVHGVIITRLFWWLAQNECGNKDWLPSDASRFR